MSLLIEIQRAKEALDMSMLKPTDYSRVITKAEYKQVKEHAKEVYGVELPDIDDIKEFKLLGFEITIKG